MSLIPGSERKVGFVEPLIDIFFRFLRFQSLLLKQWIVIITPILKFLKVRVSNIVIVFCNDFMMFVDLIYLCL